MFFFIYINYKLNRYGGKYAKNYDKYTISKKKEKDRENKLLL